jgi:hypothetical protein
MKKNASEETKAGLKNSSGRGGARPGSGPKKKILEEIQHVSIDMPVSIIGAMLAAGVENKTGYITDLIRKDLKKKGILK